MHWVGFEPNIPVIVRAKTFHASDRAATGDGLVRGLQATLIPNNSVISQCVYLHAIVEYTAIILLDNMNRLCSIWGVCEEFSPPGFNAVNSRLLLISWYERVIAGVSSFRQKLDSWAGPRFSSSSNLTDYTLWPVLKVWILQTVVKTPWKGIGPSQGDYLKRANTNRE
jgi:hypothetical protein